MKWLVILLIFLSSCAVSIQNEVHSYQKDTSRYRKFNKINGKERHYNADYFFKVRAKNMKLTDASPWF